MNSVIFDLKGFEIDQEERELLNHPLAGGVILFSRNYDSKQQLKALCQSIRAASSAKLMIAVDQEGGRVQRFKQDFIKLPALGEIGKLYDSNPDEALKWSYASAYTMASELIAVGIDLSFAPVLDLNKELNTVIGDRSFHADPSIVIILAKAFIQGMRKAGMKATGKHFPGHGSVSTDSHLDLPIDTREFAEIVQTDLQPFSQLIKAGIDAIMPAHILFPAIDNQPVGFSSYWLKTILREQLKFTGMIFSDDLNMGGAHIAGGYKERAEAALKAGCNKILICNNRPAAINLFDTLGNA